MNEAGQWTGMQGFTTQESFLNSESTQETLMDAYLIKLYPQVYGSLITPSTTKADACGILVSAYCLGVENTRLAIVSKSSDTQWVEMYIKMSKQALILNEQLL